MPIAAAAFLLVFSPTYIRPLFETSIGRLMLGLAICGVILGYVVMQRIVAIKV